jgi:hypothetical protein
MPTDPKTVVFMPTGSRRVEIKKPPHHIPLDANPDENAVATALRVLKSLRTFHAQNPDRYFIEFDATNNSPVSEALKHLWWAGHVVVISWKDEDTGDCGLAASGLRIVSIAPKAEDEQ